MLLLKPSLRMIRVPDTCIFLETNVRRKRVVSTYISVSVQQNHRLTYRHLFAEIAPLTHPWPLRAPTRIPPPSITCRREPFSLFSYFVLCACVYPELGTAGERGVIA
ncbi:unnamed protein product, partial [Laminaria digitata]